MNMTTVPDSYYFSRTDGDYTITEVWKVVSRNRSWVEVCLTELHYRWDGDGDYPEETEEWSEDEDGEPRDIVLVAPGKHYKARILKEIRDDGYSWLSAILSKDGNKKKLIRYNGTYD